MKNYDEEIEGLSEDDIMHSRFNSLRVDIDAIQEDGSNYNTKNIVTTDDVVSWEDFQQFNTFGSNDGNCSN